MTEVKATDQDNDETAKERRRLEDHIRWLEASIDSLSEENENLREDLEKLKREHDEVIPIRRHFKKQVRYHLKRVDKIITKKLSRKGNFKPLELPSDQETSETDALAKASDYDQQNFNAYNSDTKPHALMPAYETAKNASTKGARKLKRKLNKGTDK